MITIHALKDCSFTDKEKGTVVSFTKAIYETETDIGVAVVKAMPALIDSLREVKKPYDIEFYDIHRSKNKMARLYIF